MENICEKYHGTFIEDKCEKNNETIIFRTLQQPSPSKPAESVNKKTVTTPPKSYPYGQIMKNLPAVVTLYKDSPDFEKRQQEAIKQGLIVMVLNN